MSDYKNLADFLNESPVNFLAVDTVACHLREKGFTELDMRQPWELKQGGKYYVTKNGSALFAFIVGEGKSYEGFKIISAHSDSPCFRIKPNCEIVCDGNIVKLNTEVYGGAILYTWFDRPLSLAGRVVLKGEDVLNPQHRLIRFSKPMLTIPHLAIHFNRSVNSGNAISPQKDMLPVLGIVKDKGEAVGLVKRLVAKELDVDPESIIDYDLSLYDTTPATIGGLNGEFISSGRIDDLSMVHAGLCAMINAADQGDNSTRILAIFDNEETGSGTKQGAASPILDYVMRRIILSKNGSEEDYLRAIASSFMISADNAHGVHPNYVEKHDPTNHPTLGGGPVIKINANCKYMTDGDSAAVFDSLCRKAGVAPQYFVNHSDIAGGSTLGNILTSQIALRGVDVGSPIWAMHSVRETASISDHQAMIDVFTQFFLKL